MLKRETIQDMAMAQDQFTITLPEDIAALVQAKVASGAYASAQEVIIDSLHILQERHEELELWLHREVAPAYDAYKTNPENTLSLEEVQRRLEVFMDRP